MMMIIENESGDNEESGGIKCVELKVEETAEPREKPATTSVRPPPGATWMWTRDPSIGIEWLYHSVT